MAEIAAASWVVSPIIKVIVSKARSYIGNQYNWHKDIQRDLEDLVIALTSIQTVAAAAERQQSLDASQAQALCLLKDAAYEAEDLLDDYGYRMLEAQAMEARGTVSRGASSSLNFARRVFGQDELPRKLKEILNKLDGVRKYANTINVQVVGSTITSVIEQGVIRCDRDTSSFPTSEILGRAMEKDKLINLLLDIAGQTTSSYTNIPIITIVGLGGIGKTALAQYVYHDQRIKNLFNLRMWICVSDNFDEKTLTRKILECASGSNEKYKDVNNLDILKTNLKMELKSKRFLLVLDDVWIDENRGEIENEEIWKKILAPMKDGARGSKILTTTRMDIAATILGTTSFIHLDGLTNDENWSILKMNAFGNNIPNNYQELEKIGMEIIKKLKGSPLAARVVGAMLKDALHPEKWLQILKIKLLKDVMSILRLSYENLQDHLKPCFTYCSIFSKDSKFRPEKLVLLWIAQGFVHCPRGDGRPLMDIGMDYFNQLLCRSFFQKSKSTSSECYIMHDFIHDLAQIVLDECFRIDGTKQWKIPHTIRHLSVHIRSEEEFKDVVLSLKKVNNIKNLRSLIFFGSTYLNPIGHLLLLDMLKELRSLRVLDLYGLHLENFQGDLSHLRHLRYLHLSYNSLGILPESVCRLYHLTRLDVPYLEVNVGKKKKNRGVGALQGVGMKMVFPKQLRINNLQYCSGREEAVAADLGWKHSLNWLELEWGSSGRIIGHDADDEVAEALKPHPNLKQLKIKGFRGSRFPSWLVNVECLCLTDCSDLQVFPSLEHLPLLRRLEVSKCPNLTSFPLFPRTPKDIFVPVTGSVSRLKLESSSPESFVLTIGGIPQSDRAFLHDHQLRAIRNLWIKVGKEAVTAAAITKVATLKTLSIKWCPELLMSKEEMFRSLMIDDCPDTDSWLSRCLQGGLTSLSQLIIERCTGLTTLPWAELLQSLTALQVLKIWRCEDLTSLGGLHALPALKKLEIRQCPGLLTSEKDGRGVLPSSLDTLLIYDCPVPERWLSRCLQGGHTSLSELIIERCNGLTSLPSAEVLQSLTALQVLEISCCEDLTSLGSLHALAALKKLQIRQCPGLLTSEKDGRGVLPSSLDTLLIYDCPVADRWPVRCLQGGLISLSLLRIKNCSLTLVTSEEEDRHDALPSSIQLLEIENCHVTERWLSGCLQGALTSLSELRMKWCTCLTSLPSAEVLHCLTALKDLQISDCEHLTSFGGLQALAALKKLEIRQCPVLLTSEKDDCSVLPSSLDTLLIYDCPVTDRWLCRCLHGGLTSLSLLRIEYCSLTLVTSEEKDGDDVLPSSLQSLEIEHCPVTDRWLSGCLQGALTSLSELRIKWCTCLTSLPSVEVLHCLTALKDLRISGCEDLTSFGGLQALTTLKKLDISECPRLLMSEEDGCYVLPLSLESLGIHYCPVTDRWLSKCLQGGHTSLSELNIERCTGLTSLPSAEVLQSLIALQVLDISRCEDLTSSGGLHALTALKELNIRECPWLLMSMEDGGGALPLSLESLGISCCPVTDMELSRCLQGGLTSLSMMRIKFCIGLMSLPPVEVLQSLTALQVLEIWRCEDLTSLGGLHALAALKKLKISECQVLLMSERDGCCILPSSLESLEIHDCPVTDRWLSRGLQGALTSLSELEINGCTRLTSLPSAEVLHHLTALKDLWISGCEDLTSFGGLQALATLKRLEISECPRLLTSEEDGCYVLPLLLQSLGIFDCPVTDRWLSRCLQGGHTSLSELIIERCTVLTSLPLAEVLQSLPALQVLEICCCEDLTSLGGLHALASLKHLQVEECPKVKSLPEDMMPTSIEHLILSECDPALQQQIRDKKGPYWEKVAHIPHVSF